VLFKDIIFLGKSVITRGRRSNDGDDDDDDDGGVGGDDDDDDDDLQPLSSTKSRNLR
jgi:hypothetical protein